MEKIKVNDIDFIVVNDVVVVNGDEDLTYEIMPPMLYGNFKSNIKYEIESIKDETVILKEIADGALQVITIDFKQLYYLITSEQLLINL